MIHVVDNFFNKVATEVRSTYFANENHGTTENPNYWKVTKAIGNFNNGNLPYEVFIVILSNATQSNNDAIHNLIEKYIVSFGSYQYKPRKLYSENKVNQ